MNEAQQRLQCRNAILLDLEAASPASLPASTIASALRTVHVIPVDAAVLDKHLGYLEGKGLIEKRSSAISAGDARWQLTADGRDYLESEGLA